MPSHKRRQFFSQRRPFWASPREGLSLGFPTWSSAKKPVFWVSDKVIREKACLWGFRQGVPRESLSLEFLTRSSARRPVFWGSNKAIREKTWLWGFRQGHPRESLSFGVPTRSFAIQSSRARTLKYYMKQV